MNSDKELFFELYEQGCCLRCCLRFLGNDLYKYYHIEETLKNAGFIPEEDDLDDFILKYQTLYGYCCVCVGVLSDLNLQDAISRIKGLENYEFETYSISLTLPRSVSIREFSMKLHLKNKFPLRSFDENQVTLIKYAFYNYMADAIYIEYNKTFKPEAKLFISFRFIYDLDNDEMNHIMTKKRLTSVNQARPSRKRLCSVLDSVDEQKFSNVVTVPPKQPLQMACILDVKVSTWNHVIMGRYRKFSRLLPQKHLKVDGNEILSISVESIILNAFEFVLKLFLQNAKLQFQASSFDEVSVRVLGNGRSFLVTIIDCKFSITDNHLQQVQELINESNDVRVDGMRQIEKCQVKPIVDADLLKPKSYSALCQFEKSTDIEECIRQINNHREKFQVCQLLPIKIIHHDRDSSAKRKLVFRVKAQKCHRNNEIVVHIDCEAGLHVTEFIHGDLGRTNPSLSTICNRPIAVNALDLTCMTLDVP